MQRWMLGFCVCAATALLAAGGAVSSTTGPTQTYVVLYKQQAVGTGAAATVQQAGGTLVAAYDEIGVVIAQSDSDSFRGNLLKDSRIENAAATTGFAYQLPSDAADTLTRKAPDRLSVPA